LVPSGGRSEIGLPDDCRGAFGDDAPLLAASVVDRRLLDHKRSLRDFDVESGVVKVARRTPLQLRRRRLVDATVDPGEVPAAPSGNQYHSIENGWRFVIATTGSLGRAERPRGLVYVM
jgi:hypothetical protein